ncbi:hypothetical protein [Nitrosomonas oligotropha]|uniref:hypothetical protein n=1 Tax=Nitrosomonas oligotropha TaxID=42354 RepID=UPI00136B76F8|nr:hypothetical protein [Nitrosomonas oligotropha]MXS81589.1 hypothetical protein [Nitrosomonas oligotropha]
MTGYATLIRYALLAALIIVCAGFVWWMASTIHDNIFDDGRAAERAEWQEKEIKRTEDLAKAIADATQALAKERETQVNGLTGALSDEIKAREKLNNDMATINRTNRGLWIDAKNCRNRTAETAGKTESASVGASGTDRIRLPGEIEQNLRDYSVDAQKVVIQYNTCREILAPLVEIVTDQVVVPGS